MKPCCLSTTRVLSSQCKTQMHIGGTTAFSAKSCPQDAQEAAEWLQQKQRPSAEEQEQEATGSVVSVPAPSADAKTKSASADGDSSAIGCCYSIGFGDMMKPCC